MSERVNPAAGAGPDGEAGTGAASVPDAPPRAPGSARVMMGRTMLVLEVFVALFGALTMFGLRLVDPVPLAIGSVLVAALCILAAGLLRRPLGWIIGTIAQVALLASGIVLPAMIAAAVVFAALFAVAYVVGGRIDVERRARHAAEIAHWEAGRAAAAGG